jgi:hypothetical protein
MLETLKSFCEKEDIVAADIFRHFDNSSSFGHLLRDEKNGELCGIWQNSVKLFIVQKCRWILIESPVFLNSEEMNRMSKSKLWAIQSEHE